MFVKKFQYCSTLHGLGNQGQGLGNVPYIGFYV